MGDDITKIKQFGLAVQWYNGCTEVIRLEILDNYGIILKILEDICEIEKQLTSAPLVYWPILMLAQLYIGSITSKFNNWLNKLFQSR